MTDLYLKQIAVGPMANFAYLIGSQRTRECFVVDPAWDVVALQRAAAEANMKIVGALLSHYHPDHCGGHLFGHDIQGVAELIRAADIPIYAHKDEVHGVQTVTGLPRAAIKACDSGDKLSLGDIEITLIHTPGHTPGSQCFLCEERLISGDTLFLSGCGRVDLPGGDSDQLYDSLANKLAKLPPSTIIYPGHHYDAEDHATLAEIKQVNPFLQANSPAAWKRLFNHA